MPTLYNHRSVAIPSPTWAKRTLLTSFTGIWKREPESVGWLGPTACGLPTSLSKTLLLPTTDGRPQLTRPNGMQTFSLPPPPSHTTKRPGLLFAPSCQVHLPFPFPFAADRCAQLMQSSVRKLAKNNLPQGCIGKSISEVALNVGSSDIKVFSPLVLLGAQSEGPLGLMAPAGGAHSRTSKLCSLYLLSPIWTIAICSTWAALECLETSAGTKCSCLGCKWCWLYSTASGAALVANVFLGAIQCALYHCLKSFMS